MQSIESFMSWVAAGTPLPGSVPRTRIKFCPFTFLSNFDVAGALAGAGDGASF